MASTILGQEYSFIDNKLTINGVEMFSVSNVSITESQEKTMNFGAGAHAVSTGKQKKIVEFSFDLSLKDIERLMLLFPLLNVTDLPEVLITYFMNNGTNKHLWVITGAHLTSDGVETALDDTEARRTYSGVAAKVTHQRLA
jgi:hypothetical protein